MSNGEDTAVKDAAAKDASHTGAPPVVPMGELGQMLVTTPNSISANYYDLLKAVVIDQSLNADQKDALLKRLKSTNPTSDRLTYRLAIAILGVIAVVSIVAIWDYPEVVGGCQSSGRVDRGSFRRRWRFGRAAFTTTKRRHTQSSLTELGIEVSRSDEPIES